MIVYVDSVSGVLYPLHGCWLDSLHLYNIQNILSCAFQCVFSPYFTSLTCTFILTQKRIIRAIVTLVEVLLTFIRFTMTYKIQRVLGDGIRDRISYMQTSSCLLYMFYRDGTFLFIPWGGSVIQSPIKILKQALCKLMDRTFGARQLIPTKQGKSYEGAWLDLLGDNDSRNLLKSIVKSYNALVIFHVVKQDLHHHGLRSSTVQ